MSHVDQRATLPRDFYTDIYAFLLQILFFFAHLQRWPVLKSSYLSAQAIRLFHVSNTEGDLLLGDQKYVRYGVTRIT